MRLSRLVPALFAVLLAAPLHAASLPFVSDDYPKALATARARNLPLFVDAWAPWCHSCRSMKEFVLSAPSLAARSGEFVWLMVNTEDAKNAAFLQSFPIDALPTFQVHDPKDGHVAVRVVGSMTLAQMNAFLDNARVALRPAGGSVQAADVALAKADAFYGQAKYAEAADAYRTALGAAPAGWPAYPRTIESLLYAYQQTDAFDRAVDLAETALPRVMGLPSQLGVAAAGLSAALELKSDAPDRKERIARLQAATQAALARPAPGVAADDVSGAYITLIDALKRGGDSAGGARTAEEWSAYLDKAAAAATNPGQRMVFDSHRLGAYLELGHPERAIPMLEASENDAPDDYNPPARLAAAYQAMKDWPKAIAASDRALARAYGPRKLRVLDTKAEIQKASGDLAGARATWQEALEYAQSLPVPQRSDARIAAFRKKLEPAPASPPAVPGGR